MFDGAMDEYTPPTPGASIISGSTCPVTRFTYMRDLNCDMMTLLPYRENWTLTVLFAMTVLRVRA
jgi:hypothetical protein